MGCCVSAAADFGRVCSHSPFGNWQGVDVEALPPGNLIAGLMQLPMMAAAERYGELIADFEAEGSWLGKPQVWLVA